MTASSGRAASPSPPPSPLPTLRGHNVILRPFGAADAAQVQRLAGSWAVARTCGRIPHPYPDGEAEAWIADQPRRWHSGEEAAFAVCSAEEPVQSGEVLVGCVGLTLTTSDRRAELGYWIGEPYWGRRLGSSAAAAAVAFGFDTLGLHKICASVLPHNQASARICLGLGMRHEGRLRQHVQKWGQVHDLDVYGILRGEWPDGGRATSAATG